MNLLGPKKRYSKEHVDQWLEEMRGRGDSRPRPSDERIRKVLSHLREIQYDVYARMARSEEVGDWGHENQNRLRYKPLSPDRAAHLFLAYMLRQARIYGLFQYQPLNHENTNLPDSDLNFLTFMRLLDGGFGPQFLDRQFQLVFILTRGQSDPVLQAVGPLLGAFALSCFSASPAEGVEQVLHELTACAEHSLVLSDDWVKEAIPAGGNAIKNLLANQQAKSGMGSRDRVGVVSFKLEPLPGTFEYRYKDEGVER